MKRAVLLAVFLLPALASFSQIPIVYYDFEDNSSRTTFQNAVEMSVNPPPSGSVFSYTTSGPGGCNTISCSNAQGKAGAAQTHGGVAEGSSLTAGAFQQGAGDPGTGATSYFQVVVNTSGFTGIRLTYDAKFGNNNAPTSSGVLISPTGAAGSWVFVGSTATPNGNAVPSQGVTQEWSPTIGNFNLSATAPLAAIANNNATLYIRVYGYGATGAGGNGTYMSLDNFTILASSTTAGKVFTTLNESTYVASYTAGASATTIARGSFTATGAGTNVTIDPSGVRMASGQTFSLTTSATVTFGASGTILGAGGIFNIASGCTLVTSNAGGVPGSIATTGANVYTAGANYTFNTATSTPFFTGTFGSPGNVTINSGTVSLNISPTITGTLAFAGTGNLNIGNYTLGLNGNVSGMSATNYLTGSATSNLSIGGSGALGTIFFNQGTDGISNNIATLTMNRTSGTATLGNKLVSGTACNLTNGKLALNGQTLVLNGTFSGNTSGCLTGSAASTLTINGSGALGTLFFDQATPGTTNLVNTFTLNRGSSGTATMGSAVSVGSGGLNLTNGTLADGGNVITVAGNINGTGTHTSSSFGKIMLTGAGATISGAKLGSVELNNAAGFSLAGSTTFEGTLTFTAGRLAIGTNNLVFGTAASIGGTPSASSMIIANTAGQVRKQVSGLGTFTFPVGDATNYSPITLEMLSGTFATGAYMGVNVKGVKHPNNANATTYLNRYWTVNVTGVTDLVYGVTSAKYVPGDVTGTEANLAMGQYTGSLPWQRYDPANTSTHTLSLIALLEAVSDFTGISNINPSVTASPASVTICPSASTNLSATAATGDPTLTYSWLPTAGLSAATGASVTASPTSTTVYTLTVTDGNGFKGTSTTTVTVENIQPITGVTTLCMPATTTLNTTTGGGTWQTASGNASVNPTTGVVTGIAAGTAVISYVMPSTCYVTTTVTVHSAPAPITGTATVCSGLTTQLNHAVSSGTWLSGSTPNATVDGTGLVTGGAAGNADITYTLPNGCTVTRVVTVTGAPPAITGTQQVCVGATTDFDNTDAGGTWSTGNSGVATVDGTGLVTGAGQGNTSIIYTNTDGCTAVRTVTVDPVPAAITGDLDVCNELTSQLGTTSTDGVWSNSAPGTVASISTGGLVTAVSAGTSTISYTFPLTGCKTTAVFTVYALPPAITGTGSVCVNNTTDFDNSDGGGTWSVSPGALATIDANGVVTGLAAGNPDVIYTNADGCTTVRNITVNAQPAAIIGDQKICQGFTSQLDGPSGGSWLCSCIDPGMAIDATGLFTGGSAGTTTVSYVLPTGCYATATMTVDATPPAITGASQVCVDDMTDLDNTDAGGTWNSSHPEIAGADANGTVYGVEEGTVTVTYTNVNGCITTKTITVNALPEPITGDLRICKGTSTTLSSATPGGFWTCSANGIAVMSAAGVLSGLEDGTTIVTYTSAEGCITTAVATIDPLPAAITGPTAVCDGETATLGSNPGGGTWTTSDGGILSIDGSGNILGEAEGTATATYTLPNSCFVTHNVAVNPQPADITGTRNVCVDGSTLLENATGGGTWQTGDADIATVDATGNVSGVSDGMVMITYALATGCRTSAEITVNPLPSPITGTAAVCHHATTDLDASETGTWTTLDGSIASVNTDGEVTGINPGITDITFALGTGCARTVTVTVNEVPTAITGDLRICDELTSALGSSPGGGTWSATGGTAATIDAAGLVTAAEAGNVTISYTLGTGCYATAEFTVDALPGAIMDMAPVCVLETITLTNSTTGGTWSSNDEAIASINTTTGAMSGEGEGNTTVTYTSAEGCVTTLEATVNALPDAITGTMQVCEGLVTDLDNPTAGGAWSSDADAIGTVDAVSGEVSGIAEGTVGVTYMLGTGCKVVTTVTVNPLPGAISGNSDVCVAQTTTLGNARPGGTWSSSDGALATTGSSTGVVTGVAEGNIYITYTLPTGCKVTTPFTVNALPADITGTFAACQGGSSAMTDPGTGGTWSSSPEAIATIDATGTVSALLAGTATITYTLPTGCRTTAAYTVNALPAAFAGDVQVCEGATGTLTNTLTGGTWLSSDATTADVAEATGAITGIAAGTADVTYTLTTGCTRTETVTVNPAVPAIAGAGQVCIGRTLMLTNTEAGGTWSSSNAAVATVGTMDGVVTGAGAGIATITYRAGTGCTAWTTITVNALPAAITGTMQVCAGLTTTLANATADGTWSSSTPAIGTVSAAGAVTGIAAGTVPVTYKLTTTGCERIATVTVNALPLPQTVTGGGSYCAGGAGVTIGLTGSVSGTNYHLRMGSANVLVMAGTNTPLNYGLYGTAGTYTVQAVNVGTGCTRDMTGSAVVSITPLVTPAVTISSDMGDTACSGLLATFTAIPVNGGAAPVYEWRVNTTVVSGSSTYAYIPANGDVVKLKMTSSAACPSPESASATKTMTIVGNQTPTITITKTSKDTTCQFEMASFRAVGAWGGTAPVYTWLRNGVPAGTGTEFTYAPADGDVITCRLTSNFRCRLMDNVTSSGITVNVDSVYVPSVTITAQPGPAVVPGKVVTLTATVEGAGPAPTYQWRLNGADLPGETSPVLKRKFNDQDEIRCTVRGSGACGLSSFNTIIMTVDESAGIADYAALADIKLAPNPNNGQFAITGRVQGVAAGAVTIEVTNMLGQVVYGGKADVRNGGIEQQINLGNTLANGMYLLNITSVAERRVMHFVLKQ